MVTFMYDSANASTTERLLRITGITGKYRGYWYLVCGADLVLQDPSCMFLVTKRLYRDIAAVFHTTPAAVERGIRTAILGGWKYGDRDALLSLLGYNATACPSNTEFLDSLVHKIRRG